MIGGQQSWFSCQHQPRSRQYQHAANPISLIHYSHDSTLILQTTVLRQTSASSGLGFYGGSDRLSHGGRLSRPTYDTDTVVTARAWSSNWFWKPMLSAPLASYFLWRRRPSGIISRPTYGRSRWSSLRSESQLSGLSIDPAVAAARFIPQGFGTKVWAPNGHLFDTVANY